MHVYIERNISQWLQLRNPQCILLSFWSHYSTNLELFIYFLFQIWTLIESLNLIFCFSKFSYLILKCEVFLENKCKWFFYIQTYAEKGTINTVFFINLFHYGKEPSSEGDIITELFISSYCCWYPIEKYKSGISKWKKKLYTTLINKCRSCNQLKHHTRLCAISIAFFWRTSHSGQCTFVERPSPIRHLSLFRYRTTFYVIARCLPWDTEICSCQLKKKPCYAPSYKKPCFSLSLLHVGLHQLSSTRYVLLPHLCIHTVRAAFTNPKGLLLR